MADLNLLLFIFVIAISCAISKMDLVIIVDMKWGVNFQKGLDFVRDIIRNSDIDSGYHRVGLIANHGGGQVERLWHLNEYSNKGVLVTCLSRMSTVYMYTKYNTDVDIVWHLNTSVDVRYNTTSNIMDAIDDQVRPVSTEIDCALEYMHDVMFTSSHGDRDNAPNFAIIVGLSSIKRNCMHPHINILSIHMYAIGIGLTLTDVRTLKALASAPVSKNSFALDSLEDLRGLEQTIFTSICSAPICEADTDSYGTPWNMTFGPLRVYDKHACPPDHTGSVYRQCAEDGIWLTPVYNCTADTLINIITMVQNDSSVRSALGSLVSFTATKNGSSPTNLVGNVQTSSDILSLIVDRVDSTEPVEEGVVEDFLDVANNLMDVNATTSWGSIITETGSGVDKVLTSIDSLVEKVVKAGNHSGMNAEFAKSNFYVTIERSQEAVGEISFPDRSSSNLPEWARRSVNGIVLPMDNHTENVSYSSIIYKDMRGMISGISNESESRKEELNSPVMSLTLFKKDRYPLKKPATITFQLFDRGLKSPRCSYWNEGLTSWDTDGCSLASFDASSGLVVCECSHLTNFAVLMSHAAATETHMKILSVISIAGCGTSMICLVLTFAFYLRHWKRVGSERAVLLLNLCVVLFVAYLVFLTGVDRVSNKDACTSVAVTLHFLYLSVFFIMLAKSAYVTKMLLLPMNRAPITKWCLLAAYGSAAVVVAVSMGITKLHGYGTDTTCWLSIHSGLLWAFVGPALFVMAANAVVVVIVLKIKLSTGAMAKKTNQEKISDGLRTILVLLPIMGLTWVFGVFSVNEDTVVFQYIFAVCNSLQGLLIFIFHCLLDHKMKQQLGKSARNTKRKAQPHALANMKAVSGTNTSQEVNLSSPSTSTRDAP